MPTLKALLLIVAFVLRACLFIPLNSTAVKWNSWHVLKVLSGDTLVLANSTNTEIRRFHPAGIEAPKLGQPFAADSTLFTRTLLEGMTVQISEDFTKLRFGDTDPFYELVRRGLAWGTAQPYTNAMRQARHLNIGLWQCNFIEFPPNYLRRLNRALQN